MLKTLNKNQTIIIGLLALLVLSSAWFLLGQPGPTTCNVASIPLHGQLLTYTDTSTDPKNQSVQASSEDIVAKIQNADTSTNIRAIVLAVDSSGGTGVAGEEVASALQHTHKPTIALIRGQGLSAAYLASVGAQTIFASTFSDVGSIGATQSYVDNALKNKQDGLTFNELSSGKFKDTGNPDKPLTPDEKTLLLRDINIGAQNFISLVARQRHLSVEKVTQLADGSSMMGTMALDHGLIDKIGGMYEVKAYLATLLKTAPIICGASMSQNNTREGKK